ncbi:MAG TPA: hypothetical protein PKC25_15680, partial [Candidatus Rifleibacterium sp.]|nr:hypothetical protein [Candidatus Rifleibacterium sp.]
ELFESYPDLAKVRTHINISETVKEPTGSFARSYYDPEREQTISPRIIVWARNLTDAKQVLMHEIQHAIQEKEGFARGGSPKQFEDESVSAARKRVASSYAKIRDEIFENASPEFRSAARKVNRAHDIKFGANEQSEEYFQARAEFAEKFGEEAEEYLMNSDFADQATRGEISFDANGKYVVPRNRYEQYHSLAGEIEARDVEFRSDLSAEERLEYPPFDSADVDPEDAIVRYSKKDNKAADPAKVIVPKFAEGREFIGNQKLPDGIVAILDDEKAASAIKELYNYALSGGQDKKGIAYRVVSEAESKQIGLSDEISSDFKHTIDNYGIKHGIKEHEKAETELSRGQLPVTAEDFAQIPQIVRPENFVRYE